jgi:mono/diheme cytochrome c family protein
MSKATFKLLVLAGLLLGLSGCMRGCTSSRPPIHPNPNMDIQPKYRAQSSSAFFYNGSTMRLQVEGTVAQGELFEDTAFYTGFDEAGEYVAEIPFPTDAVMLARGAERYAIYCMPCHGAGGSGRGVLFTRSGVESADLHEERLRDVADGQIFDTITNGLGLMSGYKYPIPPEDRWAIIAYVRDLQTQSGS